MKAIMYAGLVGKYVDMQRPRTDEVEMREAVASGIDPTTPVGGAGVVAMVEDKEFVGGWGVYVMFEYGMGFAVLDDDGWTFSIWDRDKAPAASIGRR